ncbi:hypothetical protein [Massilia aerilata]|uniref:Restriction endonuclease subunit S n=1 Tax=Massilia aerilata TaxID=453817 RepID=A0ABW0S1R1_9BURK
MSVPKYQEYRDSGERWLGTVPSHWDVCRLKNLFEIRKRIVGEEGHQVLSITQRGIKVKDIESNEGQLSMDYSKYQVVNPGDFAMNHMDLLTGFVDISSHAGVTSPDYRVFTIRDGVLCDPRYFLYLLQNGYRQKIFYAFGQGASEFGRWRFPTDQFNGFRFPCPPHKEQNAIAAFLDRETAKIDALIAEQVTLITLLAEKRQATIAHVVTKGINPNAPMKDSRVAWLGEVPAHWEVVRIKRVISSIEQGWSPQCENFPISSADEWGVLKVGCVNGGVFRPTENKKLPPELKPVPAYSLKRGDLLISRANTRELVGSAAAVETDFDNLMLCDKLYRLRLHEARCTPFYLAAYLGTPQARSQIELEATGASSSMLNIGQSVILDLPAPIPSVAEQNEIQEFLRSETGRLDALNAVAERAIALLKERRSALIAAAITGQIDVRGAIPQAAIESSEAIAA